MMCNYGSDFYKIKIRKSVKERDNPKIYLTEITDPHTCSHTVMKRRKLKSYFSRIFHKSA